jgi:ankyrin repeat protein
MYAARMVRKEVMTLLLDRGAPINEVSDEKRTALDFAEDAEISAVLAAHGAVAGSKN